MQELEHAVALETDRPRMPDFCVCCGRTATESYKPEPPSRMKGMPQPVEPLAFPYCTACKAHLRASQNRKSSNLVALNLAIWGIGLPLAVGLPAASLLIGPALGGYLYMRNKRSDLRASAECSAEGSAVRVTWLRKHSYEFSFTRKETAKAFLELNRSVLSDR
ncbi:MAG: hypothetical protein M3R13_01640 [Armatimonadota bacterium]|nr:hypothetical protein [Armatimonadota bacterium]